ncbi:MAG: metal ABC transporter permease [bacterium]
MYELMLAPFIACLILTGIYAYFGIHIIEREIIFVDLALAQIAALGAISSILFGVEIHSTSAYLISLLFTLIGAGIFSLTRVKDKKVSQEAIIGIVYAVSTAGAILVLTKIPEEAEHIKGMLVGNILFVTGVDIFKIFIVAILVGIFHIIWRKTFLKISLYPREAENQGIRIKLWDFLFYATFGLVVTTSVAVAGVLLVFSYLIVPAVCAGLVFEKISKRLILGWIIGILTSIIGLFLSYQLDLPTGAAIVCTFGVILVAFWILRRVLGSDYHIKVKHFFKFFL